MEEFLKVLKWADERNLKIGIRTGNDGIFDIRVSDTSDNVLYYVNNSYTFEHFLQNEEDFKIYE